MNGLSSWISHRLSMMSKRRTLTRLDSVSLGIGLEMEDDDLRILVCRTVKGGEIRL
jgi:hypothetical protein